jgi:putative RecB family exonuclease
MSLPLPSSLSPSKVASFKDCALAFRFSVIDKLPEPPSPWAVKGTIVHRALERLFWSFPPGERTVEVALAQLEAAWSEAADHPDVAGLELGAEEAEAFLADAGQLVRGYFELEDPNRVNFMGVELALEARLGSMLLRGIIDRLDVDDRGELVVTDYKTGRVPGQASEQARLGGVHFYAYLCEKALGRRPARVQLLYLREPVAIVTSPSDQSTRGLEKRSVAVWSAIDRACHQEDFRPKPSALCNYCAFKPYCPAFGGDPEQARRELSETPALPLPA